MVDEKMSYDSAMQTCSRSSGNFKYGGLATVWDIHDDQFIRALMNEDDTARESYWIGLSFK